MIKLIDANFNKEDMYSEATIQTEYGKYCGYAFVHPEDEDKVSSFLGCEIAEARAIIDYCNEKIKRVNIEIKILEELNHCAPIVDKKLKEKQDYKKLLQNNVKSLKDGINLKINNRITLLQKIEKKKQAVK